MEKQCNNKNNKNNKLIILIQLFIGGVIGAIGGIFLVEKLFSGEWKLITFLGFFLFIFIAIFININIHEFGHFIFGKISGYSLISYRISIFAWNNENGKMRLSIMKNKGYSGLCAMLPPKQELPNYKNVLFYAGGIILNIISGLIFLLSIFLFSNLTETSIVILNILGSTALFLGIVNLIPFFSLNNPTDGKIIWSLILKKPFAKKLIEINKMTSQLSAGIRPRDMKISFPVDKDNLQLFELLTILYLYFKALDNNNLENILHYTNILEKNIEKFPHHALPSVYYELCYIGCITNDKEKAKVYYEKGGKILQTDKDINGLRVKGYYEYYINNNEKLSNMFCDNALAVADKFPIKGQALMEKDLVLALKEKIITKYQ